MDQERSYDGLQKTLIIQTILVFKTQRISLKCMVMSVYIRKKG